MRLIRIDNLKKYWIPRRHFTVNLIMESANCITLRLESCPIASCTSKGQLFLS